MDRLLSLGTGNWLALGLQRSEAAMRLWSLHPSFLDRQGLLGQWREAIQAKNALLNPDHPSNIWHARQLQRFKESPAPMRNIAIFLHVVADEMILRGYHPNVSLIPYYPEKIPHYISVTSGQVDYEIKFLQAKLEKRNPTFLPRLWNIRLLMFNQLNPVFKEVGGDIEPWEKL